MSCSGEHSIGGSLEQAGLLCASFGGSCAHIADKLLSHVGRVPVVVLFSGRKAMVVSMH